ncbi:hypothetical protein [Aliidiomarina celeris]|uniref:hypothetical protein n=1 Tax=Aliidiomarina celeris TaxID=2249428 RepID=UPI000DE86B78|nr:hypothetical protein [Aliidiomarina celeris]
MHNLFSIRPRAIAIAAVSVLSFGALSISANAQEPGTTEFSGMIFLNGSQQEPANGNDNFNVDLKRFFLNVNHQFSSDWSMHVTTDFQWQRYQDPSDPILRHFYVQKKISDTMRVRIGNAPTPWILPIAQLNGYRYLDPGLLPRAGHGAPADYGVHLEGETGDFGYAVAAITGGGFQKPRLGDSVDFEGRVYWQPLEGLRVHLGAYRGTLTQDKDDRPKIHTAERWNSAITYNQGKWRAGAQYFYANNWRRVSLPTEDAASGYSLWGSYQLNANYAIALRHDLTTPSRRLDSTREIEYYSAALEWRYNPKLRFSAVLKHVNNSNNASRAINNEFGIWSQIVF